MSLLLAPTNGSKPHVEKSSWLQQTVQQFFQGFNWEDQPAEVQQLRAAAQADNAAPLSLKLSVSQFFGSINWEGNRSIALPTHPDLPLTEDLLAIDAPPKDDGFTLDDFSGLF
ncbi:MAG: hypothetical protein HC781_10875 [Leptolyngbyaceae cyanobacterium CSU_1_4]|nr:hypothetical protein [Leptolyngbyaceae cyanobacterium CSU_1_4]